VTSGDLLTLDISLVRLHDFYLWFASSSFVGSYTLLIFLSSQQKKYFYPTGLISNICFVFCISIANAGNP